MLVAAALVPETALLVPGVAGAHHTVAEERAATLGAVGDLVAADPDVVVVVTAGPTGSAVLDRAGALWPTLAAAGVDDAVLAWRPTVPGAAVGVAKVPEVTAVTPVTPVTTVMELTEVTEVTEVAAAVGLLVLAQVGWAGTTRALRVAPPDGSGLRELGRRLAAGPERVALLLVASLSARHGPDAPLADDPRAEPFDAAVLADLVEPGPEALTRLAQVPPALAAELAVSAWAPWQVLVGAAADGLGHPPLRGDLRRVSAPFGATYAVIVWRPE